MTHVYKGDSCISYQTGMLYLHLYRLVQSLLVFQHLWILFPLVCATLPREVHVFHYITDEFLEKELCHELAWFLKIIFYFAIYLWDVSNLFLKAFLSCLSDKQLMICKHQNTLGHLCFSGKNMILIWVIPIYCFYQLKILWYIDYLRWGPAVLCSQRF